MTGTATWCTGRSAANFNPECAGAGRITIAEVEHLVEPGEIDPATVHTPGVFVQRVVHVPDPREADRKGDGAVMSAVSAAEVGAPTACGDTSESWVSVTPP